MSRNFLPNVEIVGATMVYRERCQCCHCLDQLYEYCDRVVILLDNYDKETEQIILGYKNKYPDRTHITYSTTPVGDRNEIRGQQKRRFKLEQARIREQMIKELKKLHEQKSIDLLLWWDSDEIAIDEFPKYLTEFWKNNRHSWMMLGFVEPFDNFRMITSSRMAPHGRVFKYNPEMTIYPWVGRTRYHPYFNTRPWKLRHVVLHLCHFTKEYRERRAFFDNGRGEDLWDKNLWILPKNVKEMTAQEIADYQPGAHQRPSKYPPITVKEYLDNKDYYLKKYNICESPKN